METVREKQKSFADTRKSNANKRWDKEKNENALAMHVHDRSICITDALHLQSSSSSSIRVLSNDNTQRDSEIIYKIYPKKVGKEAALKSIAKALKKIDANKLTEIVTQYAESQKGADMQFIPNPATWFNQGRWQDDQSTWVRENKISYAKTTYADRHPTDPEANQSHDDFLK
jgi:hypothetical protein